MISFPVTQSNIATSQSVLLAGQFTSQLQVQLSPLGIPKLKTAALLVQTFVTVALLQAGSVVVVQTVIVAAAQSVPSLPSFQSVQSLPSAPAAQVAHSGIPKLRTAADDVQELVTVAELQAGRVETLPTVIVAAAPSSQSCQGVHGVQGVQGSPFSHFRFLY